MSRIKTVVCMNTSNPQIQLCHTFWEAHMHPFRADFRPDRRIATRHFFTHVLWDACPCSLIFIHLI